MIALRCLLVIAALTTVASVPCLAGETLKLELRYQRETSSDSGRYHRLVRQEEWEPDETAVIVCDMWDLHHCLNAVRRLQEFAPRLNRVLKEARSRGVTIIHAPSDCMDAYADHPARRRAVSVREADNLPEDIGSWCSRIPAEERGRYPIDQSDGGEDDDPDEHARWAAELEAMGRNPNAPWKKQTDLIDIDSQQDYISDRGEEVWNILEQNGIRNVILTGVHTNMCVLGRPFGLRQMARNGKNVVLMRDMTDTMYNPRRWPYVSHFTGTDLIVSHIERYVCPTITSDQLLGGEPFRFENDKRPHLVIVMAEREYHTNETLPVFGRKYLGKHFRVSYVYADDEDRNTIPGLEVLDDADVALLSVRRRVLPKERLAIVRRFVDAGKPVVGIRTASHAFALRNQSPPDGHAAWPEFDRQVFGGNYHGHYGNRMQSTVRVVADNSRHPILSGVSQKPFVQGGSLYKTSPLADGTTALLTGTVSERDAEPVAWTFRRRDGGRSFYTSLGHLKDFDNPTFIRILLNGLHWATELPIRKDLSIASNRAQYHEHWTPMPVPSSWEAGSAGVLRDYDGVGWYRCVVRVPEAWLSGDRLRLFPETGEDELSVWWNGHALSALPTPNGASSASEPSRLGYAVPPAWILRNDANLLVIRVEDHGGEGGLLKTPALTTGDRELLLEGLWEFRLGDDSAWSNMPLPARFGTSTDIIFRPSS